MLLPYGVRYVRRCKENCLVLRLVVSLQMKQGVKLLRSGNCLQVKSSNLFKGNFCHSNFALCSWVASYAPIQWWHLTNNCSALRQSWEHFEKETTVAFAPLLTSQCCTSLHVCVLYTSHVNGWQMSESGSCMRLRSTGRFLQLCPFSMLSSLPLPYNCDGRQVWAVWLDYNADYSWDMPSSLQ